MNEKSNKKIENIKSSLDESIRKMLNDEQKMKKLVDAIMSEPCHLRRIK